jgi:hypothetical protein
VEDVEAEGEVTGRGEETVISDVLRADLPDNTESDLDQGVYQHLQLALDTTSLQLGFSAAPSPEGPTPEVQSVDELPIVHFSECLLAHVLLGRPVRITGGWRSGDISNTVTKVDGEHADSGESVGVGDGLVEQEQLGSGIFEQIESGQGVRRGVA